MWDDFQALRADLLATISFLGFLLLLIWGLPLALLAMGYVQ